MAPAEIGKPLPHDQIIHRDIPLTNPEKNLCTASAIPSIPSGSWVIFLKKYFII
jgi:hypothetical protein